MDFITENYLWVIIGGVIVLMIFVGFIAEKTDFGKKSLGKKKASDMKEQEEVTPNNSITENNENVMMESISDNALSSDVPFEEETVNTDVDTDSNKISPITDSEVQPKEVDDNLENNDLPNYNVEEDLNVPFGDQEVADPTGVSDVVEELNENPNEEDIWKF